MHKQPPVFQSYLLPLSLLLAFAALRWAYLLELPIFIDEAIGINWTFDASLSHLYFGGLFHGRWLDTVVRVPFGPLGPETLWLSRAVTALLSVLGAASVIGLARMLHSKPAGLAAGLLYLVLPYSIFYDRQVLGDPFAGVFGILALVAALKGTRQPRWWLAAIAGAALAAAILSKFSAVLLLPTPVLTAWIMAPRAAWKQALIQSAAAVGIAAMLVLGVHAIAYPFQEPYQSIFSPYYNWNWSRTPTDWSLTGTLQRWQTIGATLADELRLLVGWPVVGMALLGLIDAIRRSQPRPTVWLWLVGVLHFAPFLLITTWLPARYLSTVVMPLAILAGIAAAQVIGSAQARGLPPVARGAAAIGLAALLLAPNALRAARLLAHPNDPSLLPAGDYQSYFTDPQSAGTGVEAIGTALRAYAAERDLPVHVVFSQVNRMMLRAYWGGTTGELVLYDGTPDQQTHVAEWLLAQENVAFIDQGGLDEAPYGTIVETLGNFPNADGGAYRLRVVESPAPEMLDRMYRHAFGDPDAIAAEYDQLAAALDASTEMVIAYPAHQTAALQRALEGSPVEVWGAGEGWPIDISAAQREVPEAASGRRSVSVVFWNETAGDPDRQFETWLNQTLFPLREQWIGPLRVVTYLSDDIDMPGETTSHGARFGEQIELRAASVTQPDDDPRVVLIRLVWQATGPVEQSYVVGSHVLDAQRNVVAQHDGIPLSALAPTHTWTPGQEVIEQFAILIPAEAPPGRYEVRVTLYDPASMQRLPLTGGDGFADLFLLAEIEIPAGR